MIVQYPRNRPQQFRKLFVILGLFIAGFWWTVKLAFFLHDRFGYSTQIGVYLFVGNVAAIGISGMWMATRWQDANRRDFRRIYTFPRISYADKDWLEANSEPDAYTIHKAEGRWPQGEPKRLPDDLYLEFHSDHDRVLFQIARAR
jgi:hypothetical protein